MTVKEILEKFEGQFANVEFVEHIDEDASRRGFHTDRIREVEYEPSPATPVFDFELMDEAEYDRTILANSSERANFAEWYDDADAKVLVIAVKKMDWTYILIDRDGDQFESILDADNREEAAAEAKRFWDRMSEHDQSHTEEFFVAECEEIPGFDWEDWTGEDIDGFPVVLVGEFGYKMHDTFAEFKRSMV